LGVDPDDPQVDHPLADLYRALHLSAAGNGMIYLSIRHGELLNVAIRRLECAG
jgi:hypothetical protein